MQSSRLALECSLLSLNHTLLNIRESLVKWSVKRENQGESSKQILEYQQQKPFCFPGLTTGNAGTAPLRAVSAISERQKFLTTGRSGGKLKLSFWKWAWLVGKDGSNCEWDPWFQVKVIHCPHPISREMETCSEAQSRGCLKPWPTDWRPSSSIIITRT